MPPDEARPREPPPRKLADVRWYVDEDLIGFGNAMMWARTDTVTCGAAVVADVLPRRIPDTEWIPLVATRGWIAITGNRRIRESPVEAPVAQAAAARIVCVHDKRGALSTWDKLVQLARWWNQVVLFTEAHPTGPWWLSVTPSGVGELPYRVGR